jgi:amino acid permease
MSKLLKQKLPILIGLLFANLCFISTTIYFLESRDTLETNLQECDDKTQHICAKHVNYVLMLKKKNKTLNRRLRRCKKVLDHFSDLYEE